MEPVPQDTVGRVLGFIFGIAMATGGAALLEDVFDRKIIKITCGAILLICGFALIFLCIWK